MTKYILTIDLGTTLIKFGLFNFEMSLVSKHQEEYGLTYYRNFIEFDPEEYWGVIKKGVNSLIFKSGIDQKKILVISLSSQAETLILLDKNNKPLKNAISWLDNRSAEECDLLKENFDTDKCYKITGQPDIITTWPITKILWIKRHEEKIFERAYKILLLKDFIVYKLTGKFMSDYTIYNFSYYFNIIKKEYWKEILDFVGVRLSQLPELVEPGEMIGNIRSELIKEFNFNSDIALNIGALDQMAGMIGVGNINEGIVSETTGTVVAICTLLEKPVFTGLKIPCHYNAIKDTYILLPVCESGGVSLEWFKNNFFRGVDYGFIDERVYKVPEGSGGLIFLPYIVGVNSPEYNPNAKGVFYGIGINHTRDHFARAVMEGIAFLIKKNIDYIEDNLNFKIKEVISLGGGSKSSVWNQIKADILDKEIKITNSSEAASLGAAMIAAVKLGIYKNVNEIADKVIKTKKVYKPAGHEAYEKSYELFNKIYKKLDPLF